MNKFIAVIDQGTTSTRSILFNHSGNIVALSQEEHKQIYPQAGWVEHDALEILQKSQRVLKEAILKAQSENNESFEIAAIGITNQRETTIIWNKKTGKPIYNAIVWQDTRTDFIINELAKNGGQDRFRAKTGLPLAPYFSASKIKWILDNVPSARQQAQKGELLFGTIDSWLIWNLTGRKIHITDVTNASRTMLMNLETLNWDEEMLEIFDIPRAILPKIKSSSEIYGYFECPEKDEFFDNFKNIPISGNLGDQHAALFGQTCFNVGEAKNTYGTGCFMLLNTGEKPVQSKSGLLTTLAYKIGDQKAVYALEGSIAISGALIQWLRDNLGIIKTSAEVETLAKQVEDSGGIYFVPAFSGLYAPYWKSDARGIIAGLTQYINKNHIARAALESTAYQTCEVLDAMNKDSGVKLTALKVDGGMVVDDLLMQFQCDILNVPVIRSKISETTALGAAYAAGLAVGFWKNYDELRQNWKKEKEWQPKMNPEKREKLYSGWKKAVTKTFDWVE